MLATITVFQPYPLSNPHFLHTQCQWWVRKGYVRMKKLFAAIAMIAGMTTAANAAVVVDFQETVDGLEVTGSGSLDLTGLTGPNTQALGGADLFNPSSGEFAVTNGDLDVYSFSGSNSNFGTSGQILATSASGDDFLLASLANQVGFAQGYTSGTQISFIALFAGQTLASLGITPGQVEIMLPEDSIVLNFNVAQVPVPATLPLLLGGIALFGALRRRGARA